MTSNIHIVTGATGFVGSYLAYEMLARGYTLILLARNKNEKSGAERIEDNLRRFSGKPSFLKERYTVISADITKPGLDIDPPSLQKLQNVAAVWHCAALSRFSTAHEKKLHLVNVSGTKNVLDFAQQIGIERFHHLSTAYVCGNRRGVVLENELEHNEGFKNDYERTKYFAEALVHESIERYGVKGIVYRPGVIVGSSHDGATTSYRGYYYLARIFAILRRGALAGLAKDPKACAEVGIHKSDSEVTIPITIPCSTGATVNLVTIDFVVENMLNISASPASVGKVFHIVNRNPPLAAELFRLSCRFFKVSGLSFCDDLERRQSAASKTPILSRGQEQINEQIGPYVGYLRGEPVFDDHNTREILGATYRSHPPVGARLINRLLRFAVQAQWR